jgi:hypothetical protein
MKKISTTVDIRTGEALRIEEDIAPEIARAAERARMKASRAGLRIALHRLGKLEAVEAAADKADPEAAILWADAAEYTRQGPVAGLMADAGMTDEEIDAAFRLAKEAQA